MSNLLDIKLFVTHPHQCSYLSEQEATTAFVDPGAPINREVYSRLSDVGFRRSGKHLYRPRCGSCKACIAARIPVNVFNPTRNQKRCWNRNADLDVSVVNSIDTEEHYQLYERYIEQRHQDGDMYPPSLDQYRNFLTSEWGVTEYLEYRLDGELIGVAVTDRMNNGLSAVYTFFAPEHDKRSLGNFSVLWQIHYAKTLGLDSLYLGYWIKSCQKMSYKTQYRPLELLIDGQWLTVL